MQHDPHNPIPGFLPDPPQASTQGAWVIPVIAGVVTIPLLMLLWGLSQQQQPVTAQTQPVTTPVTPTPPPVTTPVTASVTPAPNPVPEANPGIPTVNAATVTETVTTPMAPPAIAASSPSVTPSPMTATIAHCDGQWVNLRQTPAGTITAQVRCGATVMPTQAVQMANNIPWTLIEVDGRQGWVAQQFLLEGQP